MACCPTAPWGNAKALHPHGTVKVIAPEDAQNHRAHQLKIHELTPQSRQDIATATEVGALFTVLTMHTTPNPHSYIANLCYSFIDLQL